MHNELDPRGKSRRKFLLHVAGFAGATAVFGVGGHSLSHLLEKRAHRTTEAISASEPNPISLGVVSSVEDPQSPETEPFQVPLPIPAVLEPVERTETKDFYVITQQERLIHIPGLPSHLKTPIWGFNGMHPGPTIKASENRLAIVRQINDLRGKTTIHLHGGNQDMKDDGHPIDLIGQGKFKDYVYPNRQRGAILWYHDHAIDVTEQQAYAGLAGFYLVEDEAERNLKKINELPDNEHDIPLLIQDKQFNSDGRFNLPPSSQESNAGLMGDKILVNGAIQPFLEVANRKYRFRLLDGSNSRQFMLALSSGEPFIQIGTEQGLLPKPVLRENIHIAPAERYDVVVDFSKYKVGSQVTLLNVGGDHESLELGKAPKEIMRFDIKREEADPVTIPEVLRSDFEVLKEEDAKVEREFVFNRKGGEWTINSRLYDPNRIDFTPRLGDTEIWTLRNKSGGWTHPIHIHDIAFQILDRNGERPHPGETGWKDTFKVLENEAVRIIGRFEINASPGTDHSIPERTYVFHCHNMPHEDHMMMGQFEVVR